MHDEYQSNRRAIDYKRKVESINVDFLRDEALQALADYASKGRPGPPAPESASLRFDSIVDAVREELTLTTNPDWWLDTFGQHQNVANPRTPEQRAGIVQQMVKDLYRKR